MIALPKLMTVDEAAEALHASVSPKAIYAAIAAGELAARRIGRRYYITPEALAAFAEPAARPASPSAPALAHRPAAPLAPFQGRAMAEAAAAQLMQARRPAPGRAKPSAVARA